MFSFQYVEAYCACTMRCYMNATHLCGLIWITLASCLGFQIGFGDNTDGYPSEPEMLFAFSGLAPFFTLPSFLTNRTWSHKNLHCSIIQLTIKSMYNFMNIQWFHAIDLHDWADLNFMKIIAWFCTYVTLVPGTVFIYFLINCMK